MVIFWIHRTIYKASDMYSHSSAWIKQYFKLCDKYPPYPTDHMKDTAVNVCLIGDIEGMVGVTYSTDCLSIAGPTASTCGPMMYRHSTILYVYNYLVYFFSEFL